MTKNSRKIIEILSETYPNAKCELDFSTPYELLVATVLSAQSTDKRVNIVTNELFKAANTPKKMLELGEEKLKKYIKSIGFYNNKSKNIIKLSKSLVDCYNSKVPDNMDDLTSLAGVGRKTANVVLSNCFSQDAIAVDTHVSRLANRLGFSNSKNVDKIEKDLQKKIDKNLWSISHHLFISHGRNLCKARNPKCDECPLQSLCKYYKSKVR